MLFDTPICDFGWNAPDFTFADPDGQKIHMSSQLRVRGVLVAIICNHDAYHRQSPIGAALMDAGNTVVDFMSHVVTQCHQMARRG